ncbi:hypothetical protein EV182_004078, partial [Spiromyces aspiralis]
MANRDVCPSAWRCKYLTELTVHGWSPSLVEAGLLCEQLSWLKSLRVKITEQDGISSLDSWPKVHEHIYRVRIDYYKDEIELDILHALIQRLTCLKEVSFCKMPRFAFIPAEI